MREKLEETCGNLRKKIKYLKSNVPKQAMLFKAYICHMITEMSVTPPSKLIKPKTRIEQLFTAESHM